MPFAECELSQPERKQKKSAAPATRVRMLWSGR
jgi:hypothetical protein